MLRSRRQVSLVNRLDQLENSRQGARGVEVIIHGFFEGAGCFCGVSLDVGRDLRISPGRLDQLVSWRKQTLEHLFMIQDVFINQPDNDRNR